jgi:hypothetical protein
MDDWKKVVLWYETKHREEEREERVRSRKHRIRVYRRWPIIAIITVAFGSLAFLTLDPTAGIVCAILAFIASVLVTEHLVADPFVVKE